MCNRRFIFLTVRITVWIKSSFFPPEVVTVSESKKAWCCFGINPFLQSISKSLFFTDVIPFSDLHFCLFVVLFISTCLVRHWLSNKKYNCSGPPAFKIQREEYQSKQKLTISIQKISSFHKLTLKGLIN